MVSTKGSISGIIPFIAHIRPEDEAEQSLYNHLVGTAELARGFASDFQAGDFAYTVGLCHDIGKYSDVFQRRIRGASIRVDHSTAGGQYMHSIDSSALGMIASYCILGHHNGLPDGGSKVDNSDIGTLYGRLKREVPQYHAFLEDFAKHSNDIELKPPLVQLIEPDIGFAISFFVRMVFSALVDADWLDTESFMRRGIVDRGGFGSLTNMQDSLHSYLTDLQSKSEKTDINTKRNELLDNCIQAAGMRSGLFTLTAPTGSGKTISSVAFALTHAIKNNQRRIFYVVPYNTIIEQNAGVFESVFGAENVIQHHSGMSYEADELDPNNNEQRRKLLATENWDAPLIVTSSVRFFESLYGNKPSICRKLHNISNSVIVLDEAQMIPLPYLKPCVAALRDLVMHYDCSVVLATATQPSLNKYFQPLTPVEIVLKPDEMHEFFKRVSIEIIPDTLANEDIINLMLSHDQVLCVVNTRKRAQEIAEQLGDCSFHLSTTMAPVHRSQVLNEIRILLKQGDICRVVSTSLVEAGVDVDFPTVYREKAGLDSIIQVAGRCNREGRYSSAVSKVFVFTAEGSSQRSIAQNISAYELVARSHDDISSPEATRDYFEQLRYMIGDENLDDNSVVSRFNSGRKTLSFPFKEIARSFKLIDDETKTIIVPFDDNVITLVNRLRFGERSRNLFRAIQQYSVSIYENELKRLNEIGAIEHIDEEILIIQDTYYDSRFGVTLAPEGGLALFG